MSLYSKLCPGVALSKATAYNSVNSTMAANGNFERLPSVKKRPLNFPSYPANLVLTSQATAEQLKRAYGNDNVVNVFTLLVVLHYSYIILHIIGGGNAKRQATPSQKVKRKVVAKAEKKEVKGSKASKAKKRLKTQAKAVEKGKKATTKAKSSVKRPTKTPTKPKIAKESPTPRKVSLKSCAKTAQIHSCTYFQTKIVCGVF